MCASSVTLVFFDLFFFFWSRGGGNAMGKGSIPFPLPTQAQACLFLFFVCGCPSLGAITSWLLFPPLVCLLGLYPALSFIATNFPLLRGGRDSLAGCLKSGNFCLGCLELGNALILVGFQECEILSLGVGIARVTGWCILFHDISISWG